LKKKNKKGVTGRTRSYAATNPWTEKDKAFPGLFMELKQELKQVAYQASAVQAAAVLMVSLP
jgi:hypothetical protein